MERLNPGGKRSSSAPVAALSLLALVQSRVSGSWHIGGRALLIPLGVAYRFRFLTNACRLVQRAIPGITHSSWNAISADPYGTRFFALQLLALTLAAALLFRYASTERTSEHP